jgi:hypothetical protein
MLNFPSSPTVGQIYTDPNAVSWEFDGVKWDVVSSTSYRAFSGVKVTRTTSYALTANSTAVSFDAEIIDTDTYFTVSTPNKVTINRTAYYRINFSVYTDSIGASYTISLKKNGSTTLSSIILSPNQYSNYDEIVELQTGDYLEVYASEDTSVGSLLNTTFLEVTRLGLLMGTNVGASEAFSGVRGILSSAFNTTSTPTAVTWSSTAFNLNADSAGNNYWSVSDPTKFIAGTTAYFRVKGVTQLGSNDTVTVALKKNATTTLSTVTVNPNGYAQIDEIYLLNVGDYLQLVVNDISSTGSLTTDTYLEMIRIGV